LFIRSLWVERHGNAGILEPFDFPYHQSMDAARGERRHFHL
jgi:hypothetical protein